MNRLFKLNLAVILIFLIVLVGCSNNEGSNTDSKEKTVIDAIENEVKVPDEVAKTVIGCHLVPQEVSILNGSDTVVTMLSQKHSQQLYKMFPEYNNVPDIGSFENINIEELLKINPDIYFGGKNSPKANEKIRELGINVYTSLIGFATPETIYDEFRNISAFYGSEKKAEKLIKYWEQSLKTLNDKIGAVPADERKRVYYANADNPLSTHNKKMWGNRLITISGGVNVAEDLPGTEVNIEQLLNWDPDIIILGKSNTKEDFVAEFKKDPRFEDLKAVKNDQVFRCPIGTTWWNIPSAESPLSFMWLSKILYPELTQDIDIKKETTQFYKQFFEYDLSDEEYDAFF